MIEIEKLTLDGEDVDLLQYVKKENFNEAILNIETEDLRFVDSVEEMVDSKKNYVLKTTGEIWSYQKTAKSYLNLADPASEDWLTNYRINSNGTLTQVSGGNVNLIMTNYIDVSNAENIHIKGLDFLSAYNNSMYNRIYLYDKDKTYITYCYTYEVESSMTIYPYWKTADYDGSVAILDWANAITNVRVNGILLQDYSCVYIRFGALCPDETKVAIAIDEEIAETTVYEFQPTGRYYGMESQEIVSSIDEMVDTSKKYVLEETSTIWRYKTKTVLSEIPELYDPSAITVSLRISSSGVTSSSATGYFVTDYLSVDMTADVPKLEIYGEINEQGTEGYPIFQRIGYFDADKTFLGAKYIRFDDNNSSYVDATHNEGVTTIYVGMSAGAKESYYDSIAYVRFDVIPTGLTATMDDAGVITSIKDGNAVAGTITTAEWSDTGIKYPASNEEALLKLEERITDNENDIAAMKTQIADLEDNQGSTSVEAVSIPDYWQEAVDALQDTIKGLYDEGGVDAFAFMWGADIHGGNGYANSNGAGTSVTKNIGSVVQYTTEKYNIPFFMVSGDIMSQASHGDPSSIDAEYEAVWEILSPIDKEKLLMEKGNHDGAYGSPVDIDGTATYYLYNIGSKKVYNRIFRPQTLDCTRVYGGDGTYYYVDTPQNVRIIMLNGHTDGDGSVDENGYAVYNSMKNGVYGTEQLTWLANAALNVPEGTRIIVSAHQPFSSSKDGTLLAGILDAYNKRTAYSNSVDVSGDYWGNGVEDDMYKISSVDADFTGAKGKVVLYAHGHIHKDTIDSTTYSFVVASITTAGGDVRDTDPVERVPGTATETALDVVILNTDKINFIRLGAGEDREASLTN